MIRIVSARTVHTIVQKRPSTIAVVSQRSSSRKPLRVVTKGRPSKTRRARRKSRSCLAMLRRRLSSSHSKPMPGLYLRDVDTCSRRASVVGARHRVIGKHHPSQCNVHGGKAMVNCATCFWQVSWPRVTGRRRARGARTAQLLDARSALPNSETIPHMIFSPSHRMDR